MARILLTAFEAYEPWDANASWLALIALTRNLPTFADITTRLYPVDLAAMKGRLEGDLKQRYDLCIHVGQSPGTARIQLEAIALNQFQDGKPIDDAQPSRRASRASQAGRICASGPAAYQSTLPLEGYAQQFRDDGIPAEVSHHAGTYLCNAVYYWSQRLIADQQLPTQPLLVHVPLDTTQVLSLPCAEPFMPAEMSAHALRTLMQMWTQQQQS